jgi:hypothetical protein
VIGEPALPTFALAAEDFSESVRVSAFDELDGVFDSDVVRWRKKQMDVFGHEDERMNLKPAFAAVAIDSLQEKTNVVLDHKQPAALPG